MADPALDDISITIEGEDNGPRLVDGNRVGVYLLQFSNGKFYIGSSARIPERISAHKWHLRHGKHYNKHMQRSWDKHQEISWKILLVCTEEDLLFYEQLCLDNLKPNLNQCRIACRTNLTPEMRANLSNILKGKKRSLEARAAISRGRMGIKVGPLSEQAKKNMSAALKGKNTYTKTPEHRSKISASLLERGRTIPRPQDVRDRIGLKSKERWDRMSAEERADIARKSVAARQEKKELNNGWI